MRQDEYRKFFKVEQDALLIDPDILNRRAEFGGKHANDFWLLLKIILGTASELEKMQFNTGLNEHDWMRVIFEKNQKGLFEAVAKRDGRHCVRCGSTERLTLDHIKPISKGGNNTLENLQILCASHNSQKGAR